ncbi:MAG: bifunctional adenosylcobinamide kinase/adenosylcobinamide-phosphate guanylyltransferase [Lachnospiraceae bacterium]|nr:bifunctional adenosylcobinamide kinase/adenosylcobinamide-phosphate guanylyltransferase [Lachnospiraceae bacterium]
MKLIIGGVFQGKKAFAQQLTGIAPGAAADGLTCGYEEIFQVPMIYHFHEYVKRRIKDGLPYRQLAEELLAKNPGVVIVTNELGYGVVPMEAFDREYRESTGRICCELAAASEEVWRVCCGIGTCIKAQEGNTHACDGRTAK